MKILVHFHFSFLLKIESNFTTIFQNSFFIFCKNEDFDFFFQIFEKNENENLTNSFFSFQKKNKNLVFKFIIQFWKQKMKIEILRIHFLIFFRFFLLPLLLRWRPRMCLAGSRSAKFAAEASITWLAHFDLQVINGATTLKKQWKLNSQWISIFIFFQNWITNLKTKFPFYFFFWKTPNSQISWRNKLTVISFNMGTLSSKVSWTFLWKIKNKIS